MVGIMTDPGETLKDRGITQQELAKTVGMAEQHISRVVQGKASISWSFALKLEHALAIPSSFWVNLQRNYDQESAEYEDRNSREKD